MPPLAMGRYEIVVTSQASGAQGELARAWFLCLPLPRLAFLLGGIVIAPVIGLHVSGVRKAHPAWWLAAPVLAGLAALVPPALSGPLMCILLAQCMGVSAFLALTAIGRQFGRIAILFGGLLLTVALMAVSVAPTTNSVAQSFTISCVFSPLWFLPLAAGTLLLRRKFTVRRLLRMTLQAWLVECFGFALVVAFIAGLVQSLAALVGCLLLPLPFMVGFFTLIGANRWCREQYVRAMGLTELTEEAQAPQISFI